MSDSIYDSLPEDNEEAFVYLEKKYRAELDDSLKDNDQGNYDAYRKRLYMNAVVAAAKSLEIPGIADFTPPPNNRGVWDAFEGFEMEVMNLAVQIEINHARRRKKYSVAFNSVAKQKIRHYIEQIRLMVDQSDLMIDKRDVIYKKLSELTLEIDRERTRFEVVADFARSVAGLSGDLEREGARPWWKWVKLLFGEIDEAKDQEPQTSLPAPENRKQLEPPRRQLPPPNEKPSGRNVDDDIPF